MLGKRKGFAVVVGARLFVLLVAGMAMVTGCAKPPQPTSTCTGTRWIMNHSALEELQSTFNTSLVEKVFAGPCTFAIPPQLHAPFSAWGMTPTATVTDASSVSSVVHGAAVVLYDPEDWSFTPLPQQRDPVRAIREAAAAAHANGATLIATPAINLMRVIDPSNPDINDAFLKANIAGQAAQYADVLEIQAQGLEANPQKFQAFVSEAAKQARAANPKIIILAGISTNPSGHSITADQLLAAAMSVKGIVDGYWLNVPFGGPYCPKCGTPQPQVAGKLLKEAAAGWPSLR